MIVGLNYRSMKHRNGMNLTAYIIVPYRKFVHTKGSVLTQSHQPYQHQAGYAGQCKHCLLVNFLIERNTHIAFSSIVH